MKPFYHPNPFKKGTLKAISVSVGLALSVSLLSFSAHSATSTAKTAQASIEVRAAKAAKISLKQAINIANKLPKGTLVSAEFDDDDRNAKGGVFEIEINSATHNHEIKVDALTGKVISQDSSRLDSGDISDYQTQQKAKINIMNAINRAEKQFGGRVMEIEFKNDRDYNAHPSYYEIELLKGNQIMEIKMDANSGTAFQTKVKS